MALTRTKAEPGRVLAGRYRLIAPIGSGASARVFLADDVKLGRRVALKMLHEALADDPDFSRRFRAEARAAAALSHPNVMAVYDWAEGDVAFIVTEFLPGGSLRSLLARDRPLSPAQALAIGLDAARALDYAHRRGLVHRDIKPANLLFGEEQRLCIADFGLARALAEAAWSEPQGAMLGTPRYAAPEQAKGEKLTGKADVYALALVLVEAVTGEVPFLADTTLGTLMARLDKDLPVSDALGPLQEVVARAGHPDPARRIDAATLVTGLLRAARQLPRPAPLHLVEVPTAGSCALDDAPSRPGASRDLGPPTEAVSLRELDSLDSLDDRRTGGRRRRWPYAMVAVVLVASVVAALAAVVVSRDDDRRPARPAASRAAVPPTVPALAGQTLEAARAAVVAAGWRPQVVRVRREATRAGQVLGSDPAAGTRVARDRTVAIEVSEGPPLVEVPSDLVGRTSDQAAFALGAAGLRARVVEERYDERAAAGTVVAVVNGTEAELERGSTVGLVVSKGPRLRPVPSGLLGATVPAATKILEDSQLKIATEAAFSETAPVGQIVSVSPAAGEAVRRDSVVTVEVSQGSPPSEVPSGLQGSTLAEATRALAAVDLEIATISHFSDRVAKGKIMTVAPPPGRELPRGSVVTVEVSRGPEG